MIEQEQKKQEIMNILKDVCTFLEVHVSEEDFSWFDNGDRFYLYGKIDHTIEVDAMSFCIGRDPSEIKHCFIKLIVRDWFTLE